jgi:two-component system, cell cycle sensor histidine kinase and response regulator CckA
MHSPTGDEPREASAGASRSRVGIMAVVFGTAIALLAGVWGFSYRSAQRSVEEARISRHAQEVIAQVHEVLALLADAQNGQNGFVLTADDRFLEPYELARARLPGELFRLRSLTADNPRHQRRLDRLEVVNGGQWNRMAQNIERRRSRGLEAVKELAGWLEGKQLMDEARAMLAEVEDEEQQLQAKEDRLVEVHTGALSWALLGLSATGLCLLGLAFAALARENQHRRRAEQGLRQLTANLDERVRERSVQLAAANQEMERALDGLRETESRYRRLVENIREIVFAGGLEGPTLARRLTFVSPHIEDVVGHPPRDFLADPGLWLRLLHPEDVANVTMETERALAKGESVVRFYRLRNERTGEYRWIEDTYVPDYGDDGAMRGFFATARDITERWTAEADAERLLHRNELLLNSAGEGIYGLDLEGRITFINPTGASILGYEVDELIDAPMHATCHHTRADGQPFPREECPIYAAFTDGRVHTVDDDVMWRKDGAAVPVQCVSTPMRDDGGGLEGAVVVFRDISERRRLEGMILQSQKLEAIGRLAGGVAHDFNNILGVITGYGELMERQLEANHPARPRLVEVLRAAERAAGLTRQLLAFSRKQEIQPRVLDLAVLVAELDQMLRRVIGEDVELQVRQAPHLGPVKADPTQLEQVIVNLVVNARDAMPKGGRLTIETANVDFDEADAATHPPAHAGRFVMLAVSDTGIGMDAETQGRIFEPFFTTKPVGEGTGLGLATVHGVVKQNGGHIWVYSEPGQGTTFKVYLPRVDEQPEAHAADAVAELLPRGDATVLLVEDTESLREMFREMLVEQGYTILQAAHGEEAMELAREYQGEIHLLLTDLVMPKMGGIDLARALAERRPEMQVLYMSGYTDGAISRQGVLRQGSALLEKPFTTTRLVHAVRDALDEPKHR